MVDLNIELPEGFLDEEVRCGYTVTRQMKEVWAVELDIASKILEVCDKHEIRIFSCGGTTLGAIRHKGFIPWDDDMDFELDRENYNKLIQIGEKEFTYPYFFQTEYTDPGSLRGHIQVRRSDTTAILLREKKLGRKFNQGIFVDIFPLDNIPDDKASEKEFRQKLYDLKDKIYRSSLRWLDFAKSSSRSKYIIKLLIFPFYKLTHKNSHDYYIDLEREANRYNNIPCKRKGLLSLCPTIEKHTRDENDLKEFEMREFEFIKVPVSKNYDSILKRTFGDYMVFERGTSIHSGIIFDTDKSYLEVMKKQL